MPNISVIVPVYKVEKYLPRCVESIMDQTYRDLEIILVDDGSPDNCGKLCDEFADKDPRIRVIHKENGGLSSARNAGIAAAQGAYIGFVDSDDYIAPEMYEKLYAALARSDADISICNYAYVDEQTGAVDQHMQEISPLSDRVLDRRQALEMLNASQEGSSFYVTAWNKLYKRALFDDCLFREGWIHEDEFLVHHIFAKAARIVTLAEQLYLYVQRGGSITNNGVNVKLLDGVYALHDRFVFFEKEGMRELAKSALVAAEWKLRTLLTKLPKTARAKAKAAVKLLIPGLVKYTRPELACLVSAWAKYILKRNTD